MTVRFASALLGIVALAAASGASGTGSGTARLSFVRYGSIVIASPELSRTAVYLRPRKGYWYDAPSWSPDGTALAATERENSNEPDLHPTTVVVLRPGKPRFSLPCDCDVPEDASWSPDGRRLVYVETEFYDPYAVGSLLVTDVSTGRERMLTHAVEAAMYSLFDGAPAWSPDGKLIAFVQHPDPPVGHPYDPDLPRYRNPAKQRRIFVIAPSGGTARKLVDIEATHPSWSPDARFIAFDDGHRIGIVGVNAGPVRFVATGTDPAWSPDGSTIAYVKGDNVWLVDLASGHARLVARHAWDPAWRPSP